MIPTTPALARPASSSAEPRARWPALALAFCGAVAAVWIGTAVVAAGHGFDTTDEGFYLLSYRWWAVDHRNFTGAAYLYGPVFDLLGHDIAGLRIFRLITVVGVHAVFGWAFMRWLRVRRPDAPPTRLWEAAGATAVVAAGGAVYGWLPATPGYNDPVLLGALLGLAAVFAMATRADRRVRAPAWPAFGLGAVIVPILLAKWAALPVVLLLAGAAVVAAAPLRMRGIRQAAAWASAGLVVTVTFVHLVVVRLDVAVPPLIEVNRLLADGSMSLPVLLNRYAATSEPILATMVRQYGLLLLAAALVVMVRHPIARLLGGAGLGVAVLFAIRDGGLGGGAVNTLRFIVPLLAVVVFALVTLVAGRLSGQYQGEGTRGWLLLVTLLVLPLVYAIGTGNIPLKVAVNAFAVWMAVLVAVLTGLRAARWLTAAVAVAALLTSACIATGGLWRHPYRGVPGAEATATATGVPALATVRIDPATAREYAALRERLRPWVEPDGRAIMGFDKMAGVVFLLGGRSVGELWYASNDRSRTALGITAECTGDRPWWGDRLPVLIFDRPIDLADRTLLGRCGFDLGANYRLLDDTGDRTVYVPAR